MLTKYALSNSNFSISTRFRLLIVTPKSVEVSTYHTKLFNNRNMAGAVFAASIFSRSAVIENISEFRIE